MTTTAEPSSPDLDTRIAIAEGRLLARQQQLRRQWSGLRTRVEQATQPRKLALPVVAGALTLLVLWRLLRHGEGSRQVQPRAARRSGAPASPLHWLRWLPLLLPLLPLRWRERLAPAASGGMLGLALPLLRRAWDGGSQRPQPVALAGLDLPRYAGLWYEIARLPTRFEDGCVSRPTAEYRAGPDGLEVINRCRTATGRERVARGLARVVPGSGGARLEVSFAPAWLRWLPLVWADHWVLHVDADYRIALVGSPGRDVLWLLAREPEPTVAQFRELVGVARRQGYDLRRLRFS